MGTKNLGKEEVVMSRYLLGRIQAIQWELEALKKALTREAEGSRRKTRLKGLWRGLKISEADVKEAQRAIFKDAYDFER